MTSTTRIVAHWHKTITPSAWPKARLPKNMLALFIVHMDFSRFHIYQQGKETLL